MDRLTWHATKILLHFGPDAAAAQIGMLSSLTCSGSSAEFSQIATRGQSQ